ncbi:MAG: hypothetical protein V4659_07120 [Pseudomonadota bacterium]
MPVRVNIEIDDSHPRFAAVMSALGGAPYSATTEASAAAAIAKPKVEPKKVEPKAEPKVEPKVEETPAAEPAEDKIALLKSLAMKFAQANGREALVALFAEYGATNPSTVPADQLDTIIARLQE